MTKITVDKETIEHAIAGAVFDFAGYITWHPDTIEVGSTADASPIVQRIRAWAKHSGLSIGSANVESWNAVLAEPAVGPTISLPRDMDEDLYYTVGSAMGAQSPDQCERADGLWCKLVARADRDKARQPPPPAEVPLLSDDDINDIWMIAREANEYPIGVFARAIEALVYQKAGLK